MKKALPVVVALLALFNVLLVVVGFIAGGRAAVHLREVAGVLRRLGGESIETTIQIKQVVPIEAQLEIIKPVGVDLAMDVHGKIPVKLNVKLDEQLAVPIEIPINEEIAVAGVPVRLEETKVRVRSDLKLEQPIKWRVASPLAPILNIKASVPLDQDIGVKFSQPVRISGRIPVRFALKEKLMVPIRLDVPVDQLLDLALPISQRATVGFPEPLKIRGDFPVVVDVPVRIPLRETPISSYLDEIAGRLESLVEF